MKEPKIMEIAVLLLAVLYATLSWNIHHILDLSIPNTQKGIAKSTHEVCFVSKKLYST